MRRFSPGAFAGRRVRRAVCVVADRNSGGDTFGRMHWRGRFVLCVVHSRISHATIVPPVCVPAGPIRRFSNGRRISGTPPLA